jgi:hypothetical protein
MSPDGRGSAPGLSRSAHGNCLMKGVHLGVTADLDEHGLLLRAAGCKGVAQDK